MKIMRNSAKQATLNTIKARITDYRSEILKYKEKTQAYIKSPKHLKIQTENLKAEENRLKSPFGTIVTSKSDKKEKNFENNHKKHHSIVEFENFSDVEEINDENQFFEEKNEVDLYQMKNNIRKIEFGMQDFHKEKFIENKKSRPLKFDAFEENETISITSLMSGLNEIKKEKDSLVSENNELKQKIERLFGSKNS